jgi:signal peptidase II
MMYELVIMLAAGVDQAIKGRIEEQKPEDFPRPLKHSGGKILLYRNHNNGFPFGFLKEKKELVRTLPLVITSMLGGAFVYLQRQKKHPLTRLALALTIGGSLSNLYDRHVRGYVIDYFSIQWGQLKKVVFNLGDIFVFLGAGILAMMELFQIRETEDK